MRKHTHYMATHKGRTAGMHLTPRAAADDFFNKYPDERRANVCGCLPGPAGTVLYPFGAPRYEVTRKTVASLDGAALWIDSEVQS